MSEKIGEYVGRRNALNRAKGANFEAQINAACDYYRRVGLADIEKTPEPMKPIKSLGHGHFEAIYTGKAQADYKGTLHGGKTVAFEAKFTDTGKMQQSRVTDAQTEHLERISRYGGVVFVLCEFKGEGIWRIPWYIFSALMGHTRSWLSKKAHEGLEPDEESDLIWEVHRVAEDLRTGRISEAK